MEQLEVVIYDEINNYEEKIKGLTFRQWIFSALMVIIVVPSIFILSKKIGDDLAQFIVTIEAAIIGFIGFIKIHDLKAEQLLPIWYRHFFKFGKPLTYITDEEWEKAHEKKNKKAKKIEAVEEPKAEKSQKVKKEKAKKEKNIKKVEVLQEKTLSDKSVDLKEDKVIAKEKEKIQQQKFAEPKLSKKELKKKKKQEKLLEKAKSKYSYLFEENEEQKEVTTEIEKETEPIEKKEAILEEIKISSESAEEPTVEEIPNIEENKTTEIENKSENTNVEEGFIGSLTPEERQKLLKKLVNYDE